MTLYSLAITTSEIPCCAFIELYIRVSPRSWHKQPRNVCARSCTLHTSNTSIPSHETLYNSKPISIRKLVICLPYSTCMGAIVIRQTILWQSFSTRTLEGGVAQWVSRLTISLWIPVSRESCNHQRPPLFYWARNFTLIVKYWLVTATDSQKNCLFQKLK